MCRIFPAIVVAIALLSNPSIAHGQKETERYIPLGKSPGLSRDYNLIGDILGVDPEKRTLQVAESTGTRTVTLTDRTKIWMDRSALRLTNISAGFNDLKIGRKVEVKFEDHNRRRFAGWIKVLVTEPEAGAGTPTE
jgi:hypothetical protein